MKRTIATMLLIISITAFLSYNMFLRSDSTANSSYSLSKYGSKGAEVKQIQEKLKRWGYYKGDIDGVYGPKTVEAVKYFQKKNGLTADGIAEIKTLVAMGITGVSNDSKSGNSKHSIDVNLLARLVYAEAREGSYTEQVAVAAVVSNRMRNPSFPNTLSGVIYQPGAFSAVSDGQINLKPDQTAKNAAQDALNGWDPSHGSLYYFNTKKTKNNWNSSRPLVIVIGDYRFYK